MFIHLRGDFSQSISARRIRSTASGGIMASLDLSSLCARSKVSANASTCKHKSMGLPLNSSSPNILDTCSGSCEHNSAMLTTAKAEIEAHHSMRHLGCKNRDKSALRNWRCLPLPHSI
jgi:hypothetical protein